MKHSRSCPHKCEGCKSPYFYEAWFKDDKCVLCTGDRGGGTYACNACWLPLSFDEKILIQSHALKYSKDHQNNKQG